MRKTKTVTMTEDDRDKGKVFLITEMPATAAEDLAMEVFFLLASSNVEVPPNVAEAGLAGLAQFGLQGLTSVPYAKAKPVLERLMACVEIIPDPQRNPKSSRSLCDDDIEEWKTRVKLRMEVFTLHVGFLPPAGLSTSTTQTSAGPVSDPAPTFLPRSRRSSAPS